MTKILIILTAAGFLSACTSNQAWTTAQSIKNSNCNDGSPIIYKRCDTILEEEFEKDQELKRELDELDNREQAIEEALARSNAPKETKKSK